MKLCRDRTPSMLDLYELKVALSDSGKPEEFLLIVCNFNITLVASVTMGTDMKVQYLRTLSHL